MKKTVIYAALLIALVLSYWFEWRIAERKFSLSAKEPVSYQELTDWQVLILAIAKTESGCNPQAMGKSNDVGILQITPIYVDEVNRLCDTASFCHNDAFSIDKSLSMFTILQDKKNPNHDLEKAIRLHNPRGASIGYSGKVMANYRFILALEEIRKQLVL